MMQMLKDRGYKIGDDQLNLTLEQVKQKLKTHLRLAGEDGQIQSGVALAEGKD